jgi:hypothetical protein
MLRITLNKIAVFVALAATAVVGAGLGASTASALPTILKMPIIAKHELPTRPVTFSGVVEGNLGVPGCVPAGEDHYSCSALSGDIRWGDGTESPATFKQVVCLVETWPNTKNEYNCTYEVRGTHVYKLFAGLLTAEFHLSYFNSTKSRWESACPLGWTASSGFAFNCPMMF